MTPTQTIEQFTTRAIEVRSISFSGDLTCDEKELSELVESIKTFGLLHPITVQRLPYDGISDKYELSAGKKRLRAVKELDHSTIQALVLDPKLSPDEIMEIHLHENLRRFNLPWYDIVEQEKELHELRLRQHGQRQSGVKRANSEKAWSLQDTANELDKLKSNLSEDFKLADALKQNPSLRKVKDRKTALKLVKEFDKRERAIAESQVPADFEMDQILCGDSLEILKSIPANTFDACITDPPWIEYKDASLIRDDSTINVFREVYRVMKPNSLLYAIMSMTDFFTYQTELAKFGFTVQKWPLLWTKSGTITHGRRSWEYARDFEPILLAAKGSPVLTIPTELSAIFNFPAVPSVKLTHPNEKPVELLKKIITHCTYDGAKILDPFAGSGVTGQAAKSLGRKYVMIERDHARIAQIEERLK